MPETIDFLGHTWTVKRVAPEDIGENSLAISDWQRLTIKVVNTLVPEIFEEVLLHEAIELTLLDNRIVEHLKVSTRPCNEDADCIAECIDSSVFAVIKNNPEWFPILRGAHALSPEARGKMPEGTVDAGRKKSGSGSSPVRD